MRARTGLWEPWVKNHPGQPGLQRVRAEPNSLRSSSPPAVRASEACSPTDGAGVARGHRCRAVVVANHEPSGEYTRGGDRVAAKSPNKMRSPNCQTSADNRIRRPNLVGADADQLKSAQESEATFESCHTTKSSGAAKIRCLDFSQLPGLDPSSAARGFRPPFLPLALAASRPAIVRS